jgi:hypothetical protein
MPRKPAPGAGNQTNGKPLYSRIDATVPLMANHILTTRNSTRIKTSREQDLRYWTQELGVNEDQLKEAVKAVGPMVDDVCVYLAR